MGGDWGDGRQGKRRIIFSRLSKHKNKEDKNNKAGKYLVEKMRALFACFYFGACRDGVFVCFDVFTYLYLPKRESIRVWPVTWNCSQKFFKPQLMAFPSELLCPGNLNAGNFTHLPCVTALSAKVKSCESRLTLMRYGRTEATYISAQMVCDYPASWKITGLHGCLQP